MDSNSIVMKAYRSLLESHELGQTNWCSHVEQILKDVDFTQAWDEQCLSNRELATVKERLYKLYMDGCLAEISDSEKNPKLRTFKLFKTTFKLENYLTSTKNISHIHALARFRISSHNLHIETGRYTKPTSTPVNDRKCLYCSSRDTEDELHFLLNCSLYSEERTDLLSICQDNIPIFHRLSENEQFIEIMSSNEPIVIKALGKYVYICMKKRSVTAGLCNR